MGRSMLLSTAFLLHSVISNHNMKKIPRRKTTGGPTDEQKEILIFFRGVLPVYQQVIDYQANSTEKANHGEIGRFFLDGGIHRKEFSDQDACTNANEQQSPFQGGGEVPGGFENTGVGPFLKQGQPFPAPYEQIHDAVYHSKERYRD